MASDVEGPRDLPFDATITDQACYGSGPRLIWISDYTGAQIKLPKLLLNGNNICMVRLFISH